MPKVFIGSIRKSSKTNELVDIIYQTPRVKSVKVIYPRAFRMTKGFAIFELEFKKGMSLKKFKSLKIRFKGELLYLADYLEGDQIRNRDTELARKKVYVSKIPRATSKDELKRLFSQFGPVETAYICREKAQKCFLYGFVTFHDENDAIRCTSLRKIPFHGRTLRVKKFTPKGETRKIVVQEDEDSHSSEELYIRRDEYMANQRQRQEAIGQGLRDNELSHQAQPEKKRYVPSINFGVRDGRINVILEVTIRNPWEPSNLRFNPSKKSKGEFNNREDERLDLLRMTHEHTKIDLDRGQAHLHLGQSADQRFDRRTPPLGHCYKGLERGLRVDF